MIKLVKSTFYKEEKTKKELIKFISRSKQLSIGNECLKFEENFANYQKRKYCVFFNSGSSAILALIQSLKNLGRILPGDKIGFSNVTWATNVMPIVQLGFEPVPVDVEIDTLNISSKKFLRVLEKSNIRMLNITNLLGFCDDIDEIAKICKKRNIILIEDNCESLGTVYKRKKLGNYGLASAFSFFVGHHISTIEGGAVCTDDEDLDTMLRLVRAHGWDRNLDAARQKKLRKNFGVDSTFYSKYTFYDLGYNLRPTEINGFLGNKQLKYLDRIIEIRSENFNKFVNAIHVYGDLYYPLRFDHIELVSNFAVPVVCRTKKIFDRIVKACEHKLEIRPIVGGDMVRQPFFKKYVKKYANGENTNSKIIHEQGLYFGNNPELTNKEMEKIIKIFTR